MSLLFFITALLVIPAALLIVIGDHLDPLEEARRIVRKNAKASDDRSAVRARLEELGRGTEKEYEEFRVKQYGYSAASASVSLILIFLVSQSFVFAVLVASLLAASMYVMLDRELTKGVKKRRELIEAEFPAIIEMLTLAIAAGETPMSAMLRIAESADGALASEFQIVVAGVRSGSPLSDTLDSMGRRVKSVMIRRFVDALVTATLRGAPLVEVLSRHAVEARGNQRNRVMGAAGKAEISMMIPVVFLILPISILFALWPSLTNLNMFAG
ncbi:MAG: type II secretion system F family protein [Acidobacteriota bacterium]|jgi:tight adherence protein C|nr:type II secretion system F family protein [Acidobacteriota bacterium]